MVAREAVLPAENATDIINKEYKAMGKTIAFFFKISIDKSRKTSIIFLALSGFV